jgi:hypothetical protein
MKCGCCGKEFVAKRSTARFCSDGCRVKNHRPNMLKRYNDLVNKHNKLVEDYNALAKEAEEKLDYARNKIEQLQAIIALEKGLRNIETAPEQHTV